MWFKAGVFVSALLLLGCGSSNYKLSSPVVRATNAGHSPSSSQASLAPLTSTGPVSTRNSKEHVPDVTLDLTSTAFREGGLLPARFTCDGSDISLPLRWKGVSKGTVEFVLTIFNLELQSTQKPFVDWAVAGLRPTLRAIAAGKLPPSAIVGRNSKGQNRYLVCPPKGHRQRYAITLYALQHRLSVKPGFNPIIVSSQVSRTAASEGLLGVALERR